MGPGGQPTTALKALGPATDMTHTDGSCLYQESRLMGPAAGAPKAILGLSGVGPSSTRLYLVGPN
jgi:hypothetical protein